MKTVFLTCGTRGAGKSTYCRDFVSHHPNIVFISRDDILIELFGSTELSPYDGGHYYAHEIMWERINKLAANTPNEDFQMILDCWNGFPEERKAIIGKLRSSGIDKVVAWRFIMPLNTVIEWFDKKNRNKFNGKEMNESRSRHDYALFNKMAENIENEGFDEVIYINPLLEILI